MRIVVLLLTCLLLLHCKSVKKNSTVSVDELIQEHFEGKAQVHYNESKSFALCWSSYKGTLLKPGNSLDYGIIDVSAKKMVYREQKYNATVEWVNDTIVKVKSNPGVRSKDEQINRAMALYYINVRTLEKSTDLDL
ncbi:MAG: hypothetical protein JEZ14_10525 [Marinilabiliaceae bacterium]|nr:hypothetical protein [Marinilabiliaceae bacterium]